ncbi:MAG: hypothetical protein WD342_04665 [Verrucomicrobiales bacterium]
MRFRLAGLLLFISAGGASGWELDSGRTLDGVPVAFDYENKSVTFENRITGGRRAVPAENLSLRSRQRLLFSTPFRRSHPEGAAGREEKNRLLRLGLLTLAGPLFLGFWIAGWFVAGKFNPLLALSGFLGSWILGGILVVCYLFFAETIGSRSAALIVGVTAATIFAAVFVSAVYGCTFVKGLLVFLLQPLAAVCVAGIGLLVFELILPKETEDRIWRHYVFAPVGLIESPSTSEKSDSSQSR